MYTIRNTAGIHDTIVGFSGSTGGSSAAAANEAATTASAMIIVRVCENSQIRFLTDYS